MPERDIGRASDLNRSNLRPAHYPAWFTLAYGRVDTAAALLRTISTLNDLSSRPTWLLFPETSPIQHCRKNTYMQKAACALKVPFVAPGNYDSRALVRETFPDPAYEWRTARSI
jgi:hypothetical protein